ncbi:MAG TPA: hypothetical protein VGT24_06810 [Candidatus Acidoferrales bacterium]|nr:hypothetical protein [Candidatus Acidoferrales bacterium]
MQHKYVADIGDYGKYALLNALCASDIRCLVIWYLTAEDAKNTDGKFRGYLLDDEFRETAPQIFDALKEMSLSIDGRNVGAVKANRVLPPNTDYYDIELSYRNVSLGDRKRFRDQWFAAAVEKSKKAELVFLDPDNGLEVKSRGPFSKMGTKYATVEEVKTILADEKSVVLYQHRNHTGNIVDQVDDVFKRLAIGNKQSSGWAISFHTFSTRIYFVFPASSHKSRLEARVISFYENPKNHVFKLQVHRLNCL